MKTCMYNMSRIEPNAIHISCMQVHGLSSTCQVQDKANILRLQHVGNSSSFVLVKSGVAHTPSHGLPLMLTSVKPGLSLKKKGANAILPLTTCCEKNREIDSTRELLVEMSVYPSGVFNEARRDCEVHVNGHHNAVQVLHRR